MEKPVFAACASQFASGNELGFTVASPAYDQAFDPPAFLGVSGVDFTVQVVPWPTAVPLCFPTPSRRRGTPRMSMLTNYW